MIPFATRLRLATYFLFWLLNWNSVYALPPPEKLPVNAVTTEESLDTDAASESQTPGNQANLAASTGKDLGSALLMDYFTVPNTDSKSKPPVATSHGLANEDGLEESDLARRDHCNLCVECVDSMDKASTITESCKKNCQATMAFGVLALFQDKLNFNFATYKFCMQTAVVAVEEEWVKL